MAASGAPASSCRHIPVNVTTAPISPRPRRSLAASLPASKGSRCSRTVAAICIPACLALAPGHRREEGELSRPQNGRTGPDMGANYPRTAHFGIFERVRVFLSALAEPDHKIEDGGNPGRRVNLHYR